MKIAIKRTCTQLFIINNHELIEHIKLWHGECDQNCDVKRVLSSNHYSDIKLLEAVHETDPEVMDSFIEKKTEHDQECKWSEIPTDGEDIELAFTFD